MSNFAVYIIEFMWINSILLIWPCTSGFKCNDYSILFSMCADDDDEHFN